MVEATPAGKAALKEVYHRAIAPISEALDSLTVKQRQELSDGLKILRETFAESPPERAGENSPRMGGVGREGSS
jgi:hypothetical protein